MPTPTITTIPPYAITQTTFMCGGKNLAGDIVSKGICWDVNPTPTIGVGSSFDVHINVTNTLDFVLHGFGLIANKKYYVRPFIITGDESTIYGTEYSFITQNSSMEGDGCTTVRETIPPGGTYIIPPGWELIGIENRNDPSTLLGCTDMNITPPCRDC